MIDRFVRRLACAALSAALAACGGGGGGSSGSSTTTPPGSTTLAPLAPPAAAALGAVLATDAATLRPLADGAASYFHGTHYTTSGAGPYESLISDAADGNGGFVERNFEVLGETDNVSYTMTVAAGTVTQRFGTAASAFMPELRSPVQVNDQFVQWRGTGVDIGDIDGDGKDDLGDVLVYATVIGTEQVDLPALARSVAAVRVDSTTVVRLPTTDAGAGAVVSSVESTWYASGLGIVRHRLTGLSLVGTTGTVLYDELLYARDGVSSGAGAIGPSRPYLPANLTTSVAQALPVVLGAAAVGDEAMLVGGSDSAAAPSSITVSVLSSRGQMLRAAELPDMDAFVGGAQLFATGDSTALLVGVGTSVFQQTTVTMQALDDTPAAVGSARTFQVAGYGATVAWDGQALWVAWSQTQPFGGARLMLQPFDASGGALAPAQVLDANTCGSIGAQVAAANGTVLVSWESADCTSTTFRYATVAGSGATAMVHTLGAAGRRDTGGVMSVPTPVVGGGVVALAWRAPIFSFTGDGPAPETDPRGVLLDASGLPVRSTSGSLDGEALPRNWARADGSPLVLAAGNGRLVAAGMALQQQLSFTVSTPDVLYASFVTPAGAPLAPASAGATTFLVTSGSMMQAGHDIGVPEQILVWPDRALVIGTVDEGAAVTQAWFD